MPEPGRVLTRDQAEESRKWAEQSLGVYARIGEGDWTLQDVTGFNGLKRLLALARSHEQLHETLDEARILLAEAYPGEAPTNRWRARVERLGAWPPAAASAGEETPLSDQARIGDFGYSGSAGWSPELDALHARVAELEKKKDELAHELEGAQFLLRDESELRDKDRERAARAEAGYERWFMEATSARGRALRAEALSAAVQEALGRERACRVWAYQQLRGWWRGNRRDMSDPAAAIAELDREEAALDDALARGGGQQETG